MNPQPSPPTLSAPQRLSKGHYVGLQIFAIVLPPAVFLLLHPPDQIPKHNLKQNTLLLLLLWIPAVVHASLYLNDAYRIGRGHAPRYFNSITEGVGVQGDLPPAYRSQAGSSQERRRNASTALQPPQSPDAPRPQSIRSIRTRFSLEAPSFLSFRTHSDGSTSVSTTLRNVLRGTKASTRYQGHRDQCGQCRKCDKCYMEHVRHCEDLRKLERAKRRAILGQEIQRTAAQTQTSLQILDNASIRSATLSRSPTNGSQHQKHNNEAENISAHSNTPLPPGSHAACLSSTPAPAPVSPRERSIHPEHSRTTHLAEAHHVPNCLCRSCTGHRPQGGLGMHTKGCVCDICQRPELSRVVDDERRNWRNDEHDTQIMGAGFLFGGAGIGDGAGDKSLTEIGHVEALKAGDDGKRIGKGARGEEKGASQGGVGRPTWLRIWGTGRRTGPRGWFW